MSDSCHTLHVHRFLVRVSYLEIYNEDVRDLLSKNVHNRLEIRERADIGVYVKDLSKFSVKNPEDMDRLMAIGNKNSTCTILYIRKVTIYTYTASFQE